MKRVYIARDPTDAHLLKGLLQGEKIEAEVHGEHSYEIGGNNPNYNTCPSVWVMNDSDYDRAMELVSIYQRDEQSIPEESGIWRCRCGEENENQFTECWSCGKTRPIR